MRSAFRNRTPEGPRVARLCWSAGGLRGVEGEGDAPRLRRRHLDERTGDLPLLARRRDLVLPRGDEDGAARAHIATVQQEPRGARRGAHVELGHALPDGREVGASDLVAAALDVVGRRGHPRDARGELGRGLLEPVEAQGEDAELTHGHRRGLELVDPRPELAGASEVEPLGGLLRLVDELLDLAGTGRRVRGCGLCGERGGKDEGQDRGLVRMEPWNRGTHGSARGERGGPQRGAGPSSTALLFIPPR
ncbi:hypothetical protein [Sorangium sp. So ce394]|uniref:hypothetical protein n=1 Tax=Sorangium sp. So ce394 TaxID=3133310 RepID=UPI003F5AFA6A